MTWSITSTTTATGRPTRRSANSSVNCSGNGSGCVDGRRFPWQNCPARTNRAAQRTRAEKMKRAAAQTVKLGLIQTDCSAESRRESQENPRAHRTRRQVRRENHLHAGTFPLAVFLPERRPQKFRAGRKNSRPQHRRLAASSRKSTRSSSSPRCSRNAPPAFITTPPPSLTPTARCSASTGRCTFRTTRCSTRNFISRPAIWVSRLGTPATEKSAC